MNETGSTCDTLGQPRCVVADRAWGCIVAGRWAAQKPSGFVGMAVATPSPHVVLSLRMGRALAGICPISVSVLEDRRALALRRVCGATALCGSSDLVSPPGRGLLSGCHGLHSLRTFPRLGPDHPHCPGSLFPVSDSTQSPLSGVGPGGVQIQLAAPGDNVRPPVHGATRQTCSSPGSARRTQLLDLPVRLRKTERRGSGLRDQRSDVVAKVPVPSPCQLVRGSGAHAPEEAGAGLGVGPGVQPLPRSSHFLPPSLRSQPWPGRVQQTWGRGVATVPSSGTSGGGALLSVTGQAGDSPGVPTLSSSRCWSSGLCLQPSARPTSIEHPLCASPLGAMKGPPAGNGLSCLQIGERARAESGRRGQGVTGSDVRALGPGIPDFLLQVRRAPWRLRAGPGTAVLLRVTRGLVCLGDPWVALGTTHWDGERG